MSLGILIGTGRGLWGLLPGEAARCLLPDLEIAAVDARDGLAVAAAAGRGVWLHDDADRAAGWRQVWEGDARAARIAPGGALLVGASPPRLLRSGDGGASWEPSPTLESVVRYQRTRSPAAGKAEWALTAIAFPPDGTLAGVGGAGVWLSMDEGRSWMPRSEGIDPAVAALYEHPDRKDRVYAVTRSGLYRSEDGGYTWLQSLTGLDRSIAHSLSVLPGTVDTLVLSAARRRPSETGALFRSTDGGVRWSRLAIGEEDEWPAAPAVTRLGGSLDTTFVLAGGRVWASHDRGLGWRPLTGPDDAARLPPVRALAVSF